MNIGSRIAAWFGGKKLPYKRRLAWIKSNGGQYIDFGFPLTLTMEIEANLGNQSNVYGSDQRILLGSHAANTGAGNYGVYTDYGYTAQEVRYYARSRTSSFVTQLIKKISPIPVNYNLFFHLKWTPTYFDVDGNVVEIGRVFTNVIENLKFAYGIFADMVVVDEGETKMNCYAVMDNNDVPCVYDEVSGEFFYNQGTGDFTYSELDEGGGYKCLISSLKSLWRSFSRVLRNASKEVRV